MNENLNNNEITIDIFFNNNIMFWLYDTIT